ncbi:MAG: hypothetical protein EOO63_18095, partial [Hymenobacter sp.]
TTSISASARSRCTSAKTSRASCSNSAGVEATRGGVGNGPVHPEQGNRLPRHHHLAPDHPAGGPGPPGTGPPTADQKRPATARPSPAPGTLGTPAAHLYQPLPLGLAR